MRRLSILAAAVCAAVCARAAYSPAGTVAFADLNTVAAHVASLASGKGLQDVLLTTTVPNAIRNPGAARLFGPMRRGASGVAVCYVDAAMVAKLSASGFKDDDALERAKIWTVYWPTATGRAAFLQRHPAAKPEASGAVLIPPGPHSKRRLWAMWSADGQWVALAPAPALAVHTPKAAAPALKRPLGNDLAYIQLSTAGARAVFGSNLCGGGAVSVRMTKAGLELHGSVRTAGAPPKPLPPDALSLAGVPAHAPLFGVTSSPDDVRSAEIFALAGPEVAAFIRQSLAFARRPGASAYYLNGAGGASAPPSARLERLLPEARKRPVNNVMFSSVTTVLKLYLPKIALTLPPTETAKKLQMQLGVRMLRAVRGDGTGFMSWHEGADDRFLIRASRDDLRGSSSLWSTLFL